MVNKDNNVFQMQIMQH